MDGDLTRKHVVVTGHVQGVFFRDSTRRVAQRHGVTGWVRNAPDGSVEVELEGAADDVAAVLAWLHRGPEQARVEGVEVTDLGATASGDRGFTVR